MAADACLAACVQYRGKAVSALVASRGGASAGQPAKLAPRGAVTASLRYLPRWGNAEGSATQMAAPRWRTRLDPDTLRVGCVHLAATVLPATLWVAAVTSRWCASAPRASAACMQSALCS